MQGRRHRSSRHWSGSGGMERWTLANLSTVHRVCETISNCGQAASLPAGKICRDFSRIPQRSGDSSPVLCIRRKGLRQIPCAARAGRQQGSSQGSEQGATREAGELAGNLCGWPGLIEPARRRLRTRFRGGRQRSDSTRLRTAIHGGRRNPPHLQPMDYAPG
jgi:hypothetical protein